MRNNVVVAPFVLVFVVSAPRPLTNVANFMLLREPKLVKFFRETLCVRNRLLHCRLCNIFEVTLEASN